MPLLAFGPQGQEMNQAPFSDMVAASGETALEMVPRCLAGERGKGYLGATKTETRPKTDSGV